MEREPRSRDRPRRSPLQRTRDLGPEQRYRFLAGASRELGASLDYEGTLAGVAGRPLPFLGAWCIVDVLDQEEQLRRVAIVHPDPEKRRLVDQLRAGWPPSRNDPFGIPTVMESREPELVPEVTDELFVQVAQDDENLRILRELSMGSLVTVPMVARGKLIGAITYVAPESGRTFSDDDVALAMDIAALSALAVENAWLHAEAHQAGREAEARRSEAEELAALAGSMNERLLLSAMKEMETAERARAMEEAKSEFTTSLSHELRTPLNAILGYVELLLGGHQGSLTEKQKTSLERARAAAQQILRLVDQILSYARIGAEREPLRLEHVDVAAVAREAMALLEPSVDPDRVAFVADLPEQEPLVLFTDGDKVRQILLNLISNAVKYTDDGEVRLEARAMGDRVRFQVIDTGSGISRNDQERIFQRFHQAEDPGSIPRGGSGLGLAITRALVGLLKGEMTMHSEPGHGTKFTIFLPSLEARQQESAGQR